jgi:hypothetical protein
MARFATFGRVTVNLDQVCSVSKAPDGSVCVRMSYFMHYEPRPGDSVSNRLGTAVGGINFGEHVFLGDEARGVWDFFQNLTHAEAGAMAAT